MKVSIVTICLNSVTTIERTIRSVQNQSYDNVEYILVDGGSSDGTLDIIDKYQSVVSILISELDDGLYDAMNKGINSATGDIIGILNSDDYYSNEETISAVVDNFEANTNLDILFGNLVFKNSAGRIVRNCRFGLYRPAFLRFGWMPPHPATFVKAEVYEKYGLYRTDFKISSDYEIFVRWLYVKKLKWQHIPRRLIVMSIGGVSTSGYKSSLLLTKELIQACKLNGLYTNYFLVSLKYPFKMLELVFKKH